MNLVFGLVDLAVILLVTGLLYLFAIRGSLPGRIRISGGKLILAGLILVVVTHVGEISYQILRSDGPEEAETVVSLFFSVERVHLLLTSFAGAMIATGFILALYKRRRHESAFLDTRRELEVSKYFEYQAEERFRYLFDSTSNSVYCYRFDPPMPIDLPIAEQVQRSYDAILQDCNVIFAKELDAEDPVDVIGGRLKDLDSSKDVGSHTAYFEAFVKGDYRLDGYDFEYRAPSGEIRSLHINMVGIIRGGLLHRMWAVESNTTDIRATKKALAYRRRFQSLVASVSSRLVMASDEECDELIEKCMGEVCNFVGADRLTMFWLNQGNNVSEASHSWSSIDNLTGSVSMALIPHFAERLRSHGVIRIDDVENLPDEFNADRTTLKNRNVKSFIALPMVVAGGVVGGMSCARLREQKDWTDQALEDLRVFAELFSNFILQLRSRRELATAMTQLQRATDRLEAENVYLRQEIELTHGFDEIIGRSDAVLRSLQLVEQVAPTRTPVLIMGETGTGKELVARAIHELSDRHSRPLVKVNCAALPANLIESELFGHEKGAFTGADKVKRGRFDLAHGSTLFLDEIGEIPVELQSKLLRVLQEGEFDRLGGAMPIKVDVRLVVATNRDLASAVMNGEFRSDLYYRVNTFPIALPALRDRGDDVQLLAEHFVHLHAPRLGREVTEISSEMMSQLQQYRWPGNVRELEGIIQRALISSNGPVLDLAEPLVADTEYDESLIGATSISELKLVEREHIVTVLEDARWKISGDSGAAAKLGIPPSTLRSKMKKLDIVRPG